MKALFAVALTAGLAAAPAWAADFGYDDGGSPYATAEQTYDDYPVPPIGIGQPSPETYVEDESYAKTYRRQHRRIAGPCMTRRGLRATLIKQGWRDLTGVAADPDVVGLTARRPSGLVYRLKIDRCSGVILAAYLLDQGGGTYAYDEQDTPSY